MQPIHAAAKNKREKEMRYLLERGANPNARTSDKNNNQPLHLVCKERWNHAVVTLLEQK